MRLLRRPPSDLTDIRQIKQFAMSNRILLELSKHYNEDELLEIAKYRDFFGDMERAARSVTNGAEVAEIYLQELKGKLSTMIGEAERERVRTGNEDMRCLYDYFIDQYGCLIKMVVVMAFEHQKQHNPDRIKMGDENRSSYDTREHNNVTPNFQSRLPEIHKSEAGTDHGMGIEVAEDALNLSSEDETTGNALGGDLDLQFHHLEGGQGYGPALNEQQKEKNGSDEKEKGWNMPQPPLTADNGTNNGENDPKQQLSENQKLNFAGGFAPSRNSGTNPLLVAQVETTLEEIKRRHGNSNTNNITLETLNNIRKERDSSDAPCRDGHAKAVVTTRNDPGASRPSDLQRSNGGAAEECPETLPTEVATEAEREEVLQSNPKDTSNVNSAGGSNSSATASASNYTRVSVYFTEVEEVKRAQEFAHLRMMDMETHLEGITSEEEREATKAYRDFYSLMKRVMGAVLDGDPFGVEIVAELYDAFQQLLGYTNVRLHAHKQFQEEQNEVARMFMLAHYMAVKQENARLKKDLEDKELEGEGPKSKK